MVLLLERFGDDCISATCACVESMDWWQERSSEVLEMKVVKQSSRTMLLLLVLRLFDLLDFFFFFFALLQDASRSLDSTFVDDDPPSGQLDFWNEFIDLLFSFFLPSWSIIFSRARLRGRTRRGDSVEFGCTIAMGECTVQQVRGIKVKCVRTLGRQLKERSTWCISGKIEVHRFIFIATNSHMRNRTRTCIQRLT